MSYIAGQLSDGFHLLGLAQLGLSPRSIGNSDCNSLFQVLVSLPENLLGIFPVGGRDWKR